jgi:hypothetical protein
MGEIMKKFSAVLASAISFSIGVMGLSVAAAPSAKADAIVTGSVYSEVYSQGNACNQAGGPASNVALSCSSLPLAYSSLTANVGATSGSVLVDLSSMPGGPGPVSYESAAFQLTLTGTYELTGGTGSGYADLDIDTFLNGAGGGGYWNECSVTLGTQNQTCGASGTLDFLVPYNTPLDLDLAISYQGAGEFGDGAYSGVNYNLGELAPVSPVPEPVTLVLLGTGLIPLMRRMRKG